MKIWLGIAFIPLICLGTLLITGLVLVAALRHKTETIQELVEKQQDAARQAQGSDSRWARLDSPDSSQEPQTLEGSIKCPACGGENRAGQEKCQFCGNNL